MITFNRLSLLIGLCPLVYLLGGLYFDYLGANVIESLTHRSGQWSLFFLFLTLLVTPLSRHFLLIELRSMRRQWGLFCFFYACVHLLTYVALDFYFEWSDIYYDIIENIYTLVGLGASFALSLLALTSTRGWRRRLKKNWNRLHNLVYVIVFLALLHFYLLVKADYLEPIIYTILFAVLLLSRIGYIRRLLYDGR